MKAWHAVLAGLLAFFSPSAAVAAEDSNGAARELAARAVTFAGAEPAFSLSYRNLSSLGPAEFGQSRIAFEGALRQAGGRIAENGAVELRITLSENATGYLLVEDAHRGDDRQVWMSSWKRTTPISRTAPGISVERKLVWEQDEQILDVAFAGDAMLVLAPTRLTLFARSGEQWVPRQSVPFTPSRPWPRDLRGHVRVQGSSFQVFLPGMTCSGVANSPLTMDCRSTDETWVLESGGRAILLASLASARNYFDGRVVTQTGAPRTVPPFYSAAAVVDRGQTVWLLATVEGKVQLFDAELNTVAGPASLPAWGSDLVSINARCGPPSQLLATRAGDGTEPDAIQSFAITDRAAAPVTAPVLFPGPVTALWSAGATSAVAVARDLTTGRYLAYVLTLACGA